jgi:hypothetical protein
MSASPLTVYLNPYKMPSGLLVSDPPREERKETGGRNRNGRRLFQREVPTLLPNHSTFVQGQYRIPFNVFECTTFLDFFKRTTFPKKSTDIPEGKEARLERARLKNSPRNPRFLWSRRNRWPPSGATRSRNGRSASRSSSPPLLSSQIDRPTPPPPGPELRQPSPSPPRPHRIPRRAKSPSFSPLDSLLQPFHLPLPPRLSPHWSPSPTAAMPKTYHLRSSSITVKLSGLSSTLSFMLWTPSQVKRASLMS